jgi:spoIIIJ-associated protein
MSDSQELDDPGSTGDEPALVLRELLERIAASMALDVEVSVEQSDETLVGRVHGEEVGPFIGRRGHTIDAIEHLAQRIAMRGEHQRMRVIVDADGYRERRAEVLREEADEAADEVVRSGEAVELEPMAASERRVVHEHLRERDDVQTHSEGEEPERFLVVSPVDA